MAELLKKKITYFENSLSSLTIKLSLLEKVPKSLAYVVEMGEGADNEKTDSRMLSVSSLTLRGIFCFIHHGKKMYLNR